MEELLKKLISTVEVMNDNINRIDHSIHHLEQRLARLEKMDSIEHRVTVNQIDLTDIKEVLEKMDTFQVEGITTIKELIKENIQDIKINQELATIKNRLDAHLIKIAKTEEAILSKTL